MELLGCIFFFKFISFEIEHTCTEEADRERQREREREREGIPRGFHAVSTEPNMGLELTNHEIMT